MNPLKLPQKYYASNQPLGDVVVYTIALVGALGASSALIWAGIEGRKGTSEEVANRQAITLGNLGLLAGSLFAASRYLKKAGIVY
jgi:hypothetical protein